MERVRTDSFDAVRGVGAVVVASSHWMNEFAHRERVDIGASVAVALFILMSGYVMAVGYGSPRKVMRPHAMFVS